MTDRAAELEAAIAADPDDPEPYLVYADWLQATDDPRGTLIVLQHRGRQDQARALLDEHRAHFLGPLATFAAGDRDDPARRRQRLELAWHLGFIREARIGWEPIYHPGARREAVEALQALLALPSSRFLRHLAIESVPTHGTADFGPFLDAIAGAARPPRLHSLFVGRWGGAPSRVGPIGAVLRACPELRHLTLRAGEVAIGELRHAELRAGEVAIGELRHAELRAFGIESHHLARGQLEDLRAAAWPRLERLELSFHAREVPAACEARDLAPLLDGDNLPSLRHLGVRRCAFADDLVGVLARSRLLPRLSSLDLSGGALSAAGVAAMARARLAFSHLAWLELDGNRLGRVARAAARGLAKHVNLGKQYPLPDDDPPAAA